MPSVKVYNQARKKVGSVDLDDGVWAVEVKEHLLYAAVRYQDAAARQGTHKAKGRSEIRGGGKKPWKQKGTGRARHGSSRSPQWRGGGVVFGPLVRSHAFKMNKAVRRAALRCALSRRVSEERVVVLDAMDLPEIKTRQVVDFMGRFELPDMLLVLDAPSDNVMKSSRNLASVTVLPAEGLNVRDVLRRRNLVVTQSAVASITDRLGS